MQGTGNAKKKKKPNSKSKKKTADAKNWNGRLAYEHT